LGGYGLALAALARVVFGAYDSYPQYSTAMEQLTSSSSLDGASISSSSPSASSRSEPSSPLPQSKVMVSEALTGVIVVDPIDSTLLLFTAKQQTDRIPSSARTPYKYYLQPQL